MDDELLSTAAVAKYTGLTADTLRKWRMSGDGPKFIRLGPRTIRYRRSAVDEFLTAREFTTTNPNRETV